MYFPLLLLGLLIFVNVRASQRILRSEEYANRKRWLLWGVWVIPFMGAFMVKNSVRAPASGVSALPQQARPLSRAFVTETPPRSLTAPGVEPFDVLSHMGLANGVPLMDWTAATAWAEGCAETGQKDEALERTHQAWLLHLRDALGPTYTLLKSDQAYVLSSLEPKVAMTMAQYIAATRARIRRVLDGVAYFPANCRSVVLVLDSQETYYHYVATYYPAEGEYAFSGGMFISSACPHFVVTRNTLDAIEPVIAHEMTHSSVAHLPIPLWLNEGLAVNTEQLLTGTRSSLYTPAELQQKHCSFWDSARIQEFWSGESFHRPDDGNPLSYDLAQRAVKQLGRDWPVFARFVSAAQRKDAGSAAAANVFSIDLGDLVCALLNFERNEAWSPNSATWAHKSEAGVEASERHRVIPPSREKRSQI